MSTHYEARPAAGEYSAEDDNQLQPEDSLIDRGVDDILDEGYSPPEQPYGPGAFGPSETLDQMLSEEEPDPARDSMCCSMRQNDSAPTNQNA